MQNLDYRKAYAKRRIKALGLNPQLNIYTTAFYECFEPDGIKVVQYLMRQAKTDKTLLAGIKNMGALEEWGKETK